MFFFKSPRIKKIELIGDIDPVVANQLIKNEFYVFILKFIIALLSLIMGCVFIWKGIESDSTIKIIYKNVLFLEFNKVLPGLILSLFSILLLLLSRLNIRIKKIN